MVARPFKAGTTTPTIDFVAERQLMRERQQSNKKSFMRRSATPWMSVASFPRVKTLGYHRTSLREKRQLRFAAERHFMVARPFKAGTTCIEVSAKFNSATGPLDTITNVILQFLVRDICN